ncbi:MAG TPA: glycosyltransferase family 2 protein [Chloroflexia bacterium]|nr:glycosyltransferase family 2 protein [Chloroflexia bacterium]
MSLNLDAAISPEEVSVVICAYTEERWEALEAAVQSVKAQIAPPLEIIVVCDHNPSLLNRIQANLSGVIALKNNQSRGLSGARNSGIEVAHGKVIAFLDDDAVAEQDWLVQLCAGYANRLVMGVGGAILPVWTSGRPDWFPTEFDWVVGCTYRGMPSTTSRVRNLIGCNMSFRRECFDVAGGFRNDIGRVGTRPVGCEETELCIRTTSHWPDKHFLYEPAAIVRHYVPHSRANMRYFFSRCYYEGVSKAFVASLVGAENGLASERSYALRTLPVGIICGLFMALFDFDLAGLEQASAIVVGFFTTVLGYFTGAISYRKSISNPGNDSLASQPDPIPIICENNL